MSSSFLRGFKRMCLSISLDVPCRLWRCCCWWIIYSRTDLVYASLTFCMLCWKLYSQLQSDAIKVILLRLMLVQTMQFNWMITIEDDLVDAMRCPVWTHNRCYESCLCCAMRKQFMQRITLISLHSCLTDGSTEVCQRIDLYRWCYYSLYKM